MSDNHLPLFTCVEALEECSLVLLRGCKMLVLRALALVAVVLMVGIRQVPVQAGSTEEWKQRTIYQLLTDRFADSESSSPCPNLSDYCGGNFQGIIEHLDYIQGMGFDAIWISPVVENTPQGYHGYWAKDLTKINSHFGTSDDLKALVTACHQKGMWVMLDVVANHMGPVGYNYSGLYPFNQSSYFHDCNLCPNQCTIQDYTCFQPEVIDCRLSGLPDLNQTNPFVRNYLLSWVKNVIEEYGFDGLRIDTIAEVSSDFWAEFTESAGVFAVGEAESNVQCVGQYSQSLPGMLSYPLFYTMRDVWGIYGTQSMYTINQTLSQYNSLLADWAATGTFLDNHDHPRFLNTGDLNSYKSALVFMLYTTGVPIIYYGTEQEYNGAADPNCREPLWPSNYNTSSPLYTFLQTLISFRKKEQIWQYNQVQRYVDDSFYAFTRGTTFVAVTNSAQQQQRPITYHPYADGTKLCNLLDASDCVVVQNQQFSVSVTTATPKVYFPSS